MKTTVKVAKMVLARVWWLGRGMATIMGIAMMLALTVGLASTALAGTGIGAVLHLGQINRVADATTQLVGTVAGPTFAISNEHDGKVRTDEQRLAPPPPGEPPIPEPTTVVPAPALGLSVHPGQTPITVNPEAGTAKDLSADELDGKDSSAFLAANAKAADADRLDGLDSSSYLKSSGKAVDSDRLDGKDSTAFANGTGGKANDADKLDGKDSTQIGVNGVQLVSAESVHNMEDSLKVAIANCPAGKIVVGTGYDVIGNSGDPLRAPHVVVDRVIAKEHSVAVRAREDWPYYDGFWSVEATAICATAP